MNKELRERLASANSLEEVKDIAKDNPELDVKKIWAEIEKHESARSEKLDLNELDAVAGGADRDWRKDGCAATGMSSMIISGQHALMVMNTFIMVAMFVLDVAMENHSNQIQDQDDNT